VTDSRSVARYYVSRSKVAAADNSSPYPPQAIWLLCAPSFLLFLCVLLFPLSFSVYVSLTDWYLPNQNWNIVGIDNYVSLLTSIRFWEALRTTSIIVAFSIVSEFVLGFALAWGLYKLQRGAQAFTIILFLPHIITPVVASLFLRWLFVSRWGLIDATLAAGGLSGPDWLGDPVWAKITIIIADIWKYTPFVMLTLYAGLQTLDQSSIEAARIDGAGELSIIRYIILPSLKNLIFFVGAIRIMDCFRLFDSIYILTGGGPGTATETITFYNYTLAFRSLEVGKAAALGILTLIILLLFLVPLFQSFNRGNESR